MWSRTVGRRRSSTVGGRFAVLLLLAMLAPVAAALCAARAAASPVDMMPPSVFGEANVGQMLVGFPGVWTSDDSLELDYQWRRCPLIGPCTDIPGASSLVYRVTPDDAGHRILLRVSARSGDATTVRDSEPSGRVPGASTPAPGASAASPPAIPAVSGPVERRGADARAVPGGAHPRTVQPALDAIHARQRACAGRCGDRDRVHRAWVSLPRSPADRHGADAGAARRAWSAGSARESRCCCASRSRAASARRRASGCGTAAVRGAGTAA